MDGVRATSAWVSSQSSHVTNDPAGIEKVTETMEDSIPKVEWDFEGIHYFDNGPLTVQYLFVLDALNFCFWPDKELTYDHLAAGLKEALRNNKAAFDADRLQKYTGLECRVGSLVVGIWDPVFFSSTSWNTLYILLSGPYDLSRLLADFSLGF